MAIKGLGTYVWPHPSTAKDTFRGYVFVKKSAAGPKDPAWAAEMERARAKFETDSVKVAEKEAKSAALDAARVAQLADQAAAAAAANRPTGAQQGTRRSSRVVRKTSLGVDDYFHKTDLQPDDDMYLGEEGKRAAEAEGKVRSGGQVAEGKAWIRDAWIRDAWMLGCGKWGAECVDAWQPVDTCGPYVVLT